LDPVPSSSAIDDTRHEPRRTTSRTRRRSGGGEGAGPDDHYDDEDDSESGDMKELHSQQAKYILDANERFQSLQATLLEKGSSIAELQIGVEQAQRDYMDQVQSLSTEVEKTKAPKNGSFQPRLRLTVWRSPYENVTIKYKPCKFINTDLGTRNKWTLSKQSSNSTKKKRQE
jgi:hypothetical protein